MSNETIFNQTKICKKCGKEKPIYEFSFKGRCLSDGTKVRRSKCKSCLKKEDSIYREKKKSLINELSKVLLNVVNYDSKRLFEITEDAFRNKVSIDFSFNFEEIQKKSLSILESKGLLEKSFINFTEDGFYLIVGDSFGKHCKTKMFDLIKKIDEHLSLKQIIHIGCMVDDTDQISNLWKDFSNKLTVVGKPEELPIVYKYKKEYNFNIVLNNVQIGLIDVVTVKNQELINHYSRTSIRSLDQYVYNGRFIVNSTKHEYFSRSVNGNNGFKESISSPGTIAEPHIRKTIKQIDFTDGYKIKEAYTTSFSKYRKMNELTKYWQNGAIIIEVCNGVPYIHPIRIKKSNNDYFTVVGGIIVDTSEESSINVEKNLIISDIHLPNHCNSSVNLLSKIIDKFKFNNVLILGDLWDNTALNPHESSFGINGDMLSDLLHTSYFLKYLKNRSENIILLGGNHDIGFTRRYLDKIPSLYSLLKHVIMKCLYESGVNKFISDRDVYETNSCVYHHGSDRMFGLGNGNILEKYAKVFFGKTCVIGHVHYMGITKDTYSVPCLCNYDQGYNSIICSNWEKGMAIEYKYKGESFIDLISFYDNGSETSVALFNEFISVNNDDLFFPSKLDSDCVSI